MTIKLDDYDIEDYCNHNGATHFDDAGNLRCSECDAVLRSWASIEDEADNYDQDEYLDEY